MVWNYHDLNELGEPAPVEITLQGVPADKAMFTHYRIDQEHSNAYSTWLKMGSPQQPTKKQITRLTKAGQLEMLAKPSRIQCINGTTIIRMELPGQGVSLIKLKW